MYQITIDLGNCDGGESCMDICPTGVLAIENDKAVAENPDDCEGCESCVETCPDEAITVEET